MIRIESPSKCCGCSACAAVCSSSAIKMMPDDMGFEYPVVDAEKCTDCGLCESICPQISDKEPADRKAKQILAFRNPDPEVLAASQSGGVFPALSAVILARGGHVYGAALNEDFSVSHRVACNEFELELLKKSKYVQSSMGSVIKSIKEDLAAGLPVLFSGTPCQCAGVRAVCGESEKLYTADIVCHGVPAPYVWSDYVALIEKEQKADVVAADFRNKARFGWSSHRETFLLSNGKTVSSRSYADIFYKHLMLRPSCAECRYNSLTRVSDISMADLWGWKNIDPQLCADDKGHSLVLVNSEKGSALFGEAKGDAKVFEVDIQKCLQRPLCQRAEFDPHTEQFKNDYLAKGLAYCLRRYGDRNVQSRSKYLYKAIRKRMRKILLGK